MVEPKQQSINTLQKTAMAILTLIVAALAFYNYKSTVKGSLLFMILGMVFMLTLLTFVYDLQLFSNRGCRRAGITMIEKNSNPSQIHLKDFINAKEVKICAFSARTFLLHSTDLLEKALDNKVSLKFLIHSPDSDAITEMEKIEKRYDIQSEVINATNEIKRLASKFPNFIEMKNILQTLYRFPIIIIVDNKGNKTGWITLSIPPRRAAEAYTAHTVQIEGGVLSDIDAYFNKCWEISENVKL